MALNERKIKILDAIIRDYISTAEPIGSRTIAKRFDLGVSSATIRNEMSDLEDMGFIVQPHLSSGRVPTDKGYRYYVDSLMRHAEMREEQLGFFSELIQSNINQIDYLMKETAKAISLLTNYTAIVSEPHMDQTRIKHIQLVPVDESQVLLVIVTDSRIVKQMLIDIGCKLSYDDLAKLSYVLSSELTGKGSDDLKGKPLFELKNSSKNLSDVLHIVLGAIEGILAAEDSVALYTSGVKNLLAFPEFSDLARARSLFNALEERNTLISIISGGGGGSVQIVIGEENDLSNLKDCSIIKANYSFGGQSYGNIGIIGPTRMDYPMVVSVLNAIVKNINRLIGDDKPD